MAMEREKTEIVSALSLGQKDQEGPERCLIVMSGKDIGQKFNVKKTLMIIGRSSEADIMISEPNISRHHAKVTVADKSVFIEDMGSTNGTHVNNERISKVELKDGDLVSIGKTVLRYSIQSSLDKAFHEEIYQSATADELTTLYNRKYFQKHVESEFSRAARYSRELSLIMVDLDNFKKINDTYGHPAGDLVLREVGTAVKNCVRRSIDIAARYGGEEIAVLLPETTLSQAVQIAEKIRKHISELKINYAGKHIPVTASIGVACTEKKMKTNEELVSKADEKLYEAKAAGKNRVES